MSKINCASTFLKRHRRRTERNTVELQWLEHLWNHENILETGVARANECLS